MQTEAQTHEYANWVIHFIEPVQNGPTFHHRVSQGFTGFHRDSKVTPLMAFKNHSNIQSYGIVESVLVSQILDIRQLGAIMVLVLKMNV